MRKLWNIVGRIAYIVSYPALALYLRKDERARVVVVCEGHILLVKSWLDSGRWYLPGGGLHKAEDPAIGAARELVEETGLQFDVTDLSHVESFRYRDKLISYDCHAYRLELSKQPKLKLQAQEITDAAWFLPEEVIAMNVHDSVKRLAEKVM